MLGMGLQTAIVSIYTASMYTKVDSDLTPWAATVL
jgi:hypothetical protein